MLTDQELEKIVEEHGKNFVWPFMMWHNSLDEFESPPPHMVEPEDWYESDLHDKITSCWSQELQNTLPERLLRLGFIELAAYASSIREWKRNHRRKR